MGALYSDGKIKFSSHYSVKVCMKEQSPLKNYLQSLAIGSLIGIGLAIVFGAGFVLRDFIDVPSVFSVNRQSATSEDYPLLDEVQALINQHYLREQPDYQTRQYGAIRGMLGALGDRNTFFIDPPVAQSESQVLAGTYGGVGVLLRRNEAGDFVMYPYPDSSALMAGVLDGDILKSVNGREITLSDQPDAVDQLLRGEVKDNNGVDVVIQRGDDELSFFIPFAVVNVPSIQWRVLDEDSRIGYIFIMRFTSRTPEELKTAFEELTASDIQTIVLDLRDNGGGLLQEAIDVAGVFLGNDVIMIQVSRTEEQEFYPKNITLQSDLNCQCRRIGRWCDSRR
jgi:carboxyl-terminal processing protease